MIAARWDNVEQSPLCTKIKNTNGVTVSTIEHIMAALAGCGVHNALIEIDGPEVPIMDGSSAPFVKGILSRGLQEQTSPIRAIKIEKPIRVQLGDAWAELLPADNLEIDFHIDFADEAIGIQQRAMNKALEILSSPNPAVLDRETDARIQAAFEGLVPGESVPPKGWVRVETDSERVTRKKRVNRRRSQA